MADFSKYKFAQYDPKLHTADYPPDDPDESIFDSAFHHCPGWLPLCETFCEKVVELFKFYGYDADTSFKILQVKEKFGAIRIYFVNPQNMKLREKLHTLVDNLEAKSAKTCSQCGAESACLTKGWILPYCMDCAIKYNAAANERHKTDYSVYETFSFPKAEG